MRFKNFSINDGLSHNSVTAFCQDQFGFIWIGTADGLNKFDGSRFVIYRNEPSDSTTISDNSILSIFEDPVGFIWVGTENGGLNRFDPRTETFTRFLFDPNNGNSISNDHVSCIVSDKKGNLWISTNKGLNKLPEEEKLKQKPSFTRFYCDKKDNKTISDNVIYSLMFDSKNSLWLSLSNGFGVDKLDFTDNNFLTYRKTNFKNNPKDPNSLSGDWVLYTFEDSKGRIWIASWNAGLNRFNPATNEFTNFKCVPNDKETLGSNYIEMIIEDNSGTIWAATYDGGLNKYVEETEGKPAHFINYKFNSINPSSLSDNRVIILFKDRTGTIWVGTAGHGLSKFIPHNQFRNIFLKSENGAITYKPSAIIKTGDGNLWVGTYEGVLFRMDKNGQNVSRYTFDYKGKPTRNFPLITSLCEDEEGTLWIATSRGGLFFVSANTLSSRAPEFRQVVPFKTNPPMSYPLGYFLVKETDTKDLLIGTYNQNGTYFISRNDKLKKRFDKVKYIPRPFTWSYAGDGQFAWIGSLFNGIAKIDLSNLAVKVIIEKNPQNPNAEGSIPNGDVYTILKAKDNTIWFGTLKSLSHFDPASRKLTNYSYKNGLANEAVYGLLEDNSDNIWSSTYNGLSKYNIRTRLFTNFYFEDGIQANEFNQFSYYKDKEGFLYFGGINGITIVNPARGEQTLKFPELKITGLHISNMPQGNKNLISSGIIKQSFNFCNEISLAYDQNAFSIQFSALEFNSPHKIKYMFKLEGFNNDWEVLPFGQNEVNFMNLDPNSYKLRIKSTNADGIWNPDFTELFITITPPFWKTSWFKLFLILIIAGIVAGVYLLREKAARTKREALQRLVDEQTLELRERNADLESFSYSVSHDLRTPLRSIYSFSQIIIEDFGNQLSDEAKSYFDKITNAAYNMTDLIDGILKMAQIARSELYKTRVNISQIAEQIIEEHKNDYSDKTLNARIQPDVYIEADLTLITTVMDNLISNAFKFSSGNEEIIIEFGKTRAFDKTKTNASEVIFLKDNGVGFDMKYGDKLFEVFQRLHSSQEFKGTGIGLANVKKIINKHGGHIWAESELDKGTTFFFTL